MIILNSTCLSTQAVEEIINKTSKKKEDINVLFITTGANLYKPEELDWLDISRFRLISQFSNVRDVDIAKDIDIKLTEFDIVYLAGGNILYLLGQIKKGFFIKTFIDYIEKGGIIAGEGAGAIILGKNIEPWLDNLDMKSRINKDINKGLELVEFSPIPHWAGESSSAYIKYIKSELERQGDIKLIRDGESLIIKDDGSIF